MRYSAVIMAPMVLALGMSRAATLEAQSATPRGAKDSATRLTLQARQRAVEWREASPVIHCGPAPLTERPGASAEVARPHVAPLEQAFLDAAMVRRDIAARSPAAVK